MHLCAKSTASTTPTKVEMKVCIYGAGAIGGWIGVKLAQAGCELDVVARGATLEALKLDGLTLVSGESRVSIPVNASSDPKALGVQQLVVVAVKAFHWVKRAIS